MDKPIVVVGGGASGAIFATQYKKMVKEIPLILLERSSYIGWAGCPMPYYIAQELDKKAMSGPDVDYFREKLNIDARINQEVISIDSQNQVVEVLNNQTGLKEQLPYSKLVLAMGAKARKVAIDGFDKIREGHFKLTHPTDAIAIDCYINKNKPQKAVIMGTGAIGIEMAEAFVLRGIDVSMFSITSTFFGDLYDEDFIEPLYQRIKEKGINIFLDSQAKKIETNSQGNIKSIHLTNGKTLEADIFLTAIGVEPNLELAKTAGLSIENNSIKVSPFLETSIKNIYALGDLISSPHRTLGQNIYMPLGDVADKQALILAGYLAGKTSQPWKGVIGSATTSFFDVKLARTGLTKQQAEKKGHKVVVIEARAVTKVSAFQDSSGGVMRLLYDSDTKKILGASMIGYQAVAQFIDQVAIALTFGLTLNDMFEVDYAYSPTNSSVWNPFLVAYRKTLK